MNDDPPADDRLARAGLGGPEAAPVGPVRPWPLRGQYLVALFGGALALTAVATVNAHRLGLRRSSLAAVMAAALSAAALSAVVLTGGAVVVLGAGDLVSALVSRVLALAACPLVLAAQQPADRAHREHAAIADADYTYGSITGAVLAGIFISFFFERTLVLVIGA